MELRNANISFQSQYALNWKGEQVCRNAFPTGSIGNQFKNILTVVDFFIEEAGTRLCVYTDGHTYQERIEEQALRDRHIDRKLQAYGFHVLRYTGKEINENIQNVIREIVNVQASPPKSSKRTSKPMLLSGTCIYPG